MMRYAAVVYDDDQQVPPFQIPQQNIIQSKTPRNDIYYMSPSYWTSAMNIH